MFRAIRALSYAALLGLLSGCGDGPAVAPVSGILTHQGEPVSGVLIHFQPEDGRPSWALTDEAGRFQLEYSSDRPGALIGQHKVWIQRLVLDPMAPKPFTAAEPPSFLPALLPKYGSAATSPLKIEIGSATHSLTIDLD